MIPSGPSRSHIRHVRRLAAAAALIAAGAAPLVWAQGAPSEPVEAQVAAGKAAYTQHCSGCHGTEASGGQFAPALKGAGFLSRWQGPIDALYEYVHTSMPPTNAGGLPDETYAAILAYVARQNDASSGATPLTADKARLSRMSLPAAPVTARRGADVGAGGVSDLHPLPQWPSPPPRFTSYTPVTDAMLANPPAQDWLSWRRAHDGQGYSPLKQITPANVRGLRVVWSQPLPAGVNMNEPLVREGVLYVYGFGDEIFALDAVNGRVLWRYRRQLPKEAAANSKKTMALYGDKLFVATSDLHMLALDARTGRPVWDKEITDKPGFRNPGGPLAAAGVVMQGLTTQAAGGGLIAGFDTETGERLWTFNTVAEPGKPGGDSWNGLPADKRSGGSVWTSGTYDAGTGLAFWGTGQTYDTGPLLVRKRGLNNDALYTDTTLALEPRTGRLVWHFQHMKNDQFDLDWVFDRVIGTVKVNGADRRVVMTAGKEGLFDTLDVKTGKYLSTVDMGLQNFVRRIDPVTGDKTIDPALLPRRDRPVLVCPSSGGGRNWSPTAFDPQSRSIFVVARDVCMDMVPVSGGFLTTGVNVPYAPRPGSDGRYGVLQALDMQTGKIRWAVRQRAPYNMGVLTTAGGVLFTGSVDRQFIAYDQATGRELWRQAMTDLPNGSPISFAVDGKQYVAMVVGHGNPLSSGLGALTPEIEMPPVNSSAVYVFALPD